MPSKKLYVLCPRCQQNMKRAGSGVCQFCARQMHAHRMKGLSFNGHEFKPAGYISTGDEIDLIRPPEVQVQRNPSWRPPHFPPPCEACNGFGYTPTSDGYSQCESCKDHPGHAMSHADWLIARP